MPLTGCTFKEWFDENKEGDLLYEEYRSYRSSDAEGEKPLTFRQWAKERWDNLDGSESESFFG